MFATLRKHQSWLLAVIIIVTIISFVAYLDPSHSRSQGGGGQSSGGEAGSINGEAISIDQFNEARREGRLFYFLHYGKWPDNAETEKNGFDLDNWAYERLTAVAVMKKMKMTVSDQAAARTTRQILGVKEDQAFSAEEFNKFVQEQLVRNGVSLEDFDRFVRHQVGLEQLISLHGMSGRMITAKEAAFFYQRENEPMDTEIVTFPVTNYFSKIDISSKDLEDYYAKRAASYRIPERVELNYVRFDLTNFYGEADKKIAAITNYNQMVDRTYLEKGPANFKDDKGVVLSADQSKANLKKDNRTYLAREAAAEQARKVINAIYEGHDENYVFTTNDIYKAAAANKVTVHTTAPFDERSGPREMVLPRQANSVLFGLTDKESSDHFYPTGPLASEDAVFVVGFNHRFASQAQTLSAIRERVQSDYRMEKAYEMVRADAEKFDAAATIGLSKGQSFDALAAAQNLKVRSLPPYSISSTNTIFKDRGDFESLQQSTFTLPIGKISGFIPTEEGGMIAFVKGRLPVNQNIMARDLPLYLNKMREQRQVAAFSEWFQRQATELNLKRTISSKPAKISGS